jgi:hypothetical protein
MLLLCPRPPMITLCPALLPKVAAAIVAAAATAARMVRMFRYPIGGFMTPYRLCINMCGPGQHDVTGHKTVGLITTKWRRSRSMVSSSIVEPLFLTLYF